MRQGLVMTGAGLAALGLLVVGVGLLNLPTTHQATSNQNATLPPIKAGKYQTVTLNSPLSGATQGSITVTYSPWGSTSGTIAVYLLPGGQGCTNFSVPTSNPPGCVLGHSYANANTPGLLDYPSAVSFPYVLDFVNSGATELNVTTNVQVVSTFTTGLGLWQLTVVLAAGGVLAAIGGVIVFLGLFLKGDPYRPATMPEVLPDEEKGSDAEPGEPSSRGEEEGSKSPSSKDEPAPKEEKTLW